MREVNPPLPNLTVEGIIIEGGKHIYRGYSWDTKPSNIPEKAEFIERDTKTVYIYKQGYWVVKEYMEYFDNYVNHKKVKKID